MKTLASIALLVAALGGLGMPSRGQSPPPPPDESSPGRVAPPTPTEPAEVVAVADTEAEAEADAAPGQPPPAEPPDGPPNDAPADDAASDTAAERSAPPAPPATRPAAGPRSNPAAPAPANRNGNATTNPITATDSGAANLRLNFRGAPLEMVLDYLSEAAGFTIVLETEVRGKLDVWSNQPMTKDEAVELLNQVLNKNGYAALRQGRTLTILSRDDAKKRDIPVRAGADPASIPKSEEIVTQIIPVRFINAVQLTRDLQPLFPSSATIASNEGGNAVVVTDTLANIHRIAQIVRALDTAISAVSSVRVFPLQHADAKALATVVRDLFQAQGTTGGRTGNQQQQQTFRGFRGPGGIGFPGAPGANGGNQGGSSGSGGSRVATPTVVAVADERSNALVVSAPEEQMPIIEDLVKQVDTPVEEITELRVFPLQHADPEEMSELIQSLFPDSSSSQAGQRGQFRFGGPFGMAGGARSTTTDSARLQKQSKIVAVPDKRTRSIVVTAARDLMEQVAGMIQQLDADPARKQKVFVYSVENTDTQSVEDILRGMFETQNTRNRTTTRNNNRQTGNQLNNRANTTQTQGGTRNTGNFGGNR